MITPMRHVTLICRQDDAQEVLASLQAFGELHLQAEQASSREIEQRMEELTTARSVLQKLQTIESPAGIPPEESPEDCILRAQRLM
jgi:hypothetical protein